MSFEIIPTPVFEKELKQLARKYPSLKTDLCKLFSKLTTDPITGTPLGNNCYKIRLAITFKKQGKSGGARVITYLKVKDNMVFLIAIYDKSDLTSLVTNDLIKRLKKLR